MQDLYHLDHFLGHFQNQFKDVLDHSGFKVLEATPKSDETCDVRCLVDGNQDKPVHLLFKMCVKDIGRNKGCWMTATLLREDAQ